MVIVKMSRYLVMFALCGSVSCYFLVSFSVRAITPDVFKMIELMLQYSESTSAAAVLHITVFNCRHCFSHRVIFDVYGLYRSDIPRRNVKL